MEDDITERSIDDIAGEMVKDLTVGMDGTDVKAGWIKVGTAYLHVTKGEEMVIRAAVRAANATGVAISTHTTNGTMGIEQLEIAKDEGFDLTRMTIGHVDRLPDLWYHRKMFPVRTQINLTNILTIHLHSSICCKVKADHQIQNCGFPCS